MIINCMYSLMMYCETWLDRVTTGAGIDDMRSVRLMVWFDNRDCDDDDESTRLWT